MPPIVDGRPRKYPWDLWKDGKAREIVRGEDFSPAPASMASTIRQHGKRCGWPVAVCVRGNSVLFQFTRPEET